MIELPEVETMRRDLEREVVGKRVKLVDVDVPRTVSRSGNRKKFAARLDKAKFSGVERRGLLILMELDTGDVLIVDLASRAQLRRAANKDEIGPGTTVIITFTQQGQLRLVDPDGKASMFIVDGENLETEVPELAALGFDPVEQPMSWTAFGELLRRSEVTLRAFLLDSSSIVGLGPLYTDEILFNAGLRYDRITQSLTAQEIRRFYRAIVETLHDALKYRGTTLEDGKYLDVFGKPGSYQEHLNVYQRHGELSPRSRKPIVRTKVSGVWTYYCDQSQV
jgi:formamidopyrimidine-DNA glycosylase